MTRESPRHRIAVLVNPSAGAGAGAEQVGLVRAAFERAADGVDVHVEALDRAQLARRVDAFERAGFDTIVAAGGDGTVSAVATCLTSRPIRLGVLPIGTLNHFARDLGLPLELDRAVEVVLHGESRSVDVGCVNERQFVNNASLGLYPDQLRMRARLRHRLWKWAAAFLTGVAALRRVRSLWIKIETGEELRRRRCAMIMVGNGVYDFDGGDATSRSRLDQGRLGLYVFTEIRRLGLVLGVLRVMIGRASTVRRLEVETMPAVTLHVHRRRVPIALDGEVTTLRSPLRFRSLPGALRVLVPRTNA